MLKQPMFDNQINRLKKAFVDKSSLVDIDHYITVALDTHEIMGDADLLKGIVTNFPKPNTTVGGHVHLNRFGTSKTASAMYKMGMIPEASEITLEMVEDNAAFNKRRAYIEDHGGKLTVAMVSPYGIYTPFIEQVGSDAPKEFDFINPDYLNKMMKDNNIGSLMHAAGYSSIPITGGLTYLFTGDTSTSAIAGVALSGLGLAFLGKKYAEASITAHQAITSFGLVITTNDTPRRRIIEPEVEKRGWDWGFGDGMPSPA